MTPELTDLVRRMRTKSAVMRNPLGLTVTQAMARQRVGDFMAEAADAIEALAAAQEWLSEDTIAAVEAGNRRWHGITEQSVRWEPYKPGGQRQMKAKGRWQVQEWSGDFFKWANLMRRPDGVRPVPPVKP